MLILGKTRSMSRRTTGAVLAVAASLAIACTSSPAEGDDGSASAEVPTCFGKTATVTVEPGDTGVSGTAGPDVIIVDDVDPESYFSVSGKGGDDLICTGSGMSGISGGRGDDRILVRSRRGDHVEITLGRGADELTGGAGVEFVDHDELVYSELHPTGTHPRHEEDRDVIRTGAGNDFVRAGQSGQPSRDVVETGRGSDTVVLGSDDRAPARGAWAVLGQGRDSVYFLMPEPVRDRVLIDNSRARSSGVAVRAGVTVLRWSGADVFDLPYSGGYNISFRGGAADETVRISSYGCHADIRGGAGDDTINAKTPNLLNCEGRPSVQLRGGPGDDFLVGSMGDDLLDGGPGRDRADGWRGQDTCVSVERVTSC